MKSVAQYARKILDTLTADLAVGDSRKLDQGKGFQPVHVERLAKQLYSVAHYYEQNGDLVPDPDMVFWKGTDGNYYPVSFQNSLGLRESARLDTDDAGRTIVTHFAKAVQADQASFCGLWMRNIRAQQSLSKALP